jgi:putative membrane protein
MKKYLELFLIMITGLLASCTGGGYYGSQGPGGWGHMMHYGFGYGGMFMWIIFLIVKRRARRRHRMKVTWIF